MTYWLMKSEPDEFGIADLAKDKTTYWDGIRNYQARNFMREMKIGDLAFLYHSSCKHIGIAGVMKVVEDPMPDPAAIDPKNDYFDPKSSPDNIRWTRVKVEFVEQFSKILPLATIKSLALKHDALSTLGLLNSSRLSVMPVTQPQWKLLSKAAGAAQ